MIQKIKKYIMLATMPLMFGFTAFVPALASADVACDNVQTGVISGVKSTVGDTVHGGGCGSDTSTDTGGTGQLKSIFARIVNIFSIIVGAIAIIMVIYGGFRYITSGGDSGRVGNAKNTLIYALIGLVIVALAQFLVRYVFNTATNLGN